MRDSAVAEWGLSLFLSKTEGGKTKRFFIYLYGINDANDANDAGDADARRT